MEDQKKGSGTLQEFCIPDYILDADFNPETSDSPPESECPVIVFVNSTSGGQLGGNLLATYRTLLNSKQVVDLLEEAPDKVLCRIYQNIEKLKQNGDELAARVEEKLRIIVAGGDGTAGWLLGVVCDLKLPHPPPLATVPLGTGNNLPFAFGWGKKNPGTDRQAVISFLLKVKKARKMKIDNWHILMRFKAPTEGTCDPIAPLDLPHSLHAIGRVSPTDSENMEGYHTFRGGFWNYFSMGMDAQVSYAFHAERKLHPEKFKNQLVNQSTYAKIVGSQGWFMASLFHPSDKNIAQLAKVKVMKGQEWKELPIPSSIRSIVCLNLPSFSGGLDPWGVPNTRKLRDRDLTPPYVDDGLIEVVGFRNAWHGLVLLAPKGHGTRLAQFSKVHQDMDMNMSDFKASRIRFEFRKGAAEHTYMRIDGEPWKQPLPVDDDTVVVEISNRGQVNMLATDECKSRSTHEDPERYSAGETSEDASEDDSIAGGDEERRKFGAADTFKMPQEFDIAHLS
ncbi:hypothetical protein V2J09_009046 [Rumex salicifolius]